jgi:hypothetical protein
MKNIKRLLTLAGIALGIAAVREQLKRPSEERSWQGNVAGVPYDLRFPPTPSRVRERWWNRDDPRLLTPHVFGVGWSVNLYRLTHPSGHGHDGEDEQKAA